MLNGNIAEAFVQRTARRCRGIYDRALKRRSEAIVGRAACDSQDTRRSLIIILARSLTLSVLLDSLNKMHAMESSGGNGKKVVDSASESKRGVDDEDSRKSPKVPQSQQNGAALPEETASADRNLIHCPPSSSFPKKEKKEPLAENDSSQHQQPQVRRNLIRFIAAN
jgi:hypothetical protein